MKTNLLIPCLAIIMTSILLPSCKKDGSLISSSQVSFGIKSDTPLTSFTTGNPSSALTWTSGIANISSFKLEAERNGVETEIKSKNLTNVNLFAFTPSMIAALIDTGTYKEIEIRVVFSKSTTTDLPLVLKGTFTNSGGVSVPVEFDFNEDAIIKAKTENVTIDGTKDIAATLSLHLNKLLSNVTAAEITAATLTNNTIVISSTSNSNIYNKIIANLISSCDSNGFEKHEKSERH